jgi:MYND finger
MEQSGEFHQDLLLNEFKESPFYRRYVKHATALEAPPKKIPVTKHRANVAELYKTPEMREWKRQFAAWKRRIYAWNLKHFPAETMADTNQLKLTFAARVNHQRKAIELFFKTKYAPGPDEMADNPPPSFWNPKFMVNGVDFEPYSKKSWDHKFLAWKKQYYAQPEEPDLFYPKNSWSSSGEEEPGLFSSMQSPCIQCSVTNPVMFRCASCLGAVYCGTECQSLHWKKFGHRAQCFDAHDPAQLAEAIQVRLPHIMDMRLNVRGRQLLASDLRERDNLKSAQQWIGHTINIQ